VFNLLITLGCHLGIQQPICHPEGVVFATEGFLKSTIYGFFAAGRASVAQDDSLTEVTKER
jgi:hypothetical protein